MSRLTRIWIYGAGAIGSSMAGLLYTAGCSVRLIGSSPHLRKIGSEGLLFQIADQPPKNLPLGTILPEDLPTFDADDMVLLTGKLTGLTAAAERLKDLLSSETRVIALQNGLNVDQTAASLLSRPVERGLIYFGANCPEVGKVKLYPGLIRLRSAPATEQLAKLLLDTPIRAELKDEFMEIEWTKLAINCIANPLAGLLGAPNSALSDSNLDPFKESILSEVREIALANGIKLAISTKDFNRYIRGATGENIASLHSDLRRGEKTEIEALNGLIVREGALWNIPTPANTLVLGLIRFLEISAGAKTNTEVSEELSNNKA